MTIYVDDAFIPAKLPGMRPAIWCHMTADTKDELHEFARSIGLRRSWFQDKPNGHWHYDVTKTVRAKAVKAGAVEIGTDLAAFRDVWHRPGREGVKDGCASVSAQSQVEQEASADSVQEPGGA